MGKKGKFPPFLKIFEKSLILMKKGGKWGKFRGGYAYGKIFTQSKDSIEKFQYVRVVERFFPTFPLQIIILCTFAHFEHIMLVTLYNILHNMLVDENRENSMNSIDRKLAILKSLSASSFYTGIKRDLEQRLRQENRK